ncbi:tyrosine-type recombinase/integrase [Methylobacterium sp. NPDC080182]|uniref:tyrosine-type recombinase/integrase n=1 Tax=Methylobacterium sp. NPDC080182 TaxID=3390590 RepID=UPI003CFE75DD
MGRKAKKLSALEVGRLKTPGMWAVGGVDGLYLNVKPTGARAWILRAMMAGKRRDHGLGGFPDVTLAMARQKARERRADIEQGQDPIAVRRQALSSARAQQASQKTFQDAAEAYIKAHGESWKNAKHRDQWASTLETYAYPSMSRLLVRDIGQEHVLQALEPIWKTKTETATRLRGRIEAVLDWARVRGYRDGENPARWRGHLDKLLPAPTKIQKVKHHRAIPADGIAAFMAELRQREGVAARALEFVTLTAARSGEVRGATWAEIDRKAKVWTVPADRMKAGREHCVPLTDAALAVLDGLPSVPGSDLVFAAPRGGPLSDMSLTAVMRRMEVDVVPHGMRSTFRDWCSERTNFPRDLAEAALAHTLESKVEAAYRRGDALEKRRPMMEAWAAFCAHPAKGGAVVPLAGVA